VETSIITEAARNGREHGNCSETIAVCFQLAALSNVTELKADG
jgi:hypothetical protein